MNGSPVINKDRQSYISDTEVRMQDLGIAHLAGHLWQALGYAASFLALDHGLLQYVFHPNCRTSQDCPAETTAICKEKARTETYDR